MSSSHGIKINIYLYHTFFTPTLEGVSVHRPSINGLFTAIIASPITAEPGIFVYRPKR